MAPVLGSLLLPAVRQVLTLATQRCTLLCPARASVLLCRRGYYQHPEEDLRQLPIPHYVQIGEYRTHNELLAAGVWPWTDGIRSRLPQHFKNRYLEKFTIKAIPVHYREEPGRWKRDEYGMLHRVENVPIPLIFPKEADQGLWGGEGFVEGWRKRNNKLIKPKTPRVWKPKLIRRVFYSEILDKHMAITVTPRLLDLVDHACGFDNYILNTKEVDMRSKLGMTLKREMLLTLVRQSMYPDDPVKREEVHERYKHHIIPEHEAEWVGYSLTEAEIRQAQIEKVQKQADPPLKHLLAEKLVEKLKNPPTDVSLVEGSSSWFSTLNPFKKPSS